MSRGPIVIGSGHAETEMHRIAMDAIHCNDAVPIVDDKDFESIAAAAFSEERIYISSMGEVVIPQKFLGLRASTKSGKMDCYKASE